MAYYEKTMAVYNRCPFHSDTGSAGLLWYNIIEGEKSQRSVNLERAQREGGVDFDLSEVLKIALAEGGDLEISEGLEYDPKISKYVSVDDGGDEEASVCASFAMLYKGEVAENDLQELQWWVLSERKRDKSGRVCIPQYEGFPVGFSVRQRMAEGVQFCVSVTLQKLVTFNVAVTKEEV